MKHTPGPWSVWESPYGWARVHARHEKTIADVMSKGGAGKEEYEANSRLIAAAPELLDALVELASIVDGVRNGEGAIDSFTLQPARAAIAAATGQVAVATKDVAPKENQTLTAPETTPGKSKAPGGKSGEAPGKSRFRLPPVPIDVDGDPIHEIEIRKRHCGHREPLASGFCPDCEQMVNLLPVAEKSPAVASESLDVAEKSPLPECSICRGRHGREVTHACE